MNHPKEQLQDECRAYLLGELDEQSLIDFESRLDSPEVADELIRQSEVLVAISAAQISPQPAVSLHKIDHSPALLRWKTPALFAVVAVAILLIVSLSQPSDDHARSAEQSLDLQIAKAWVEQPRPESSQNEPDWLSEPEFETMDEFEVSDFETPGDSTSWLVVAVAAEENIAENNVDG